MDFALARGCRNANGANSLDIPATRLFVPINYPKILNLGPFSIQVVLFFGGLLKNDSLPECRVIWRISLQYFMDSVGSV